MPSFMSQSIRHTTYWEQEVEWMIQYNTTLDQYHITEVFYSMLFRHQMNLYMPWVYDDGTAIWRRDKPLVILR